MTQQPNLFAGIAGYIGRPGDVGEVGVFRRAADSQTWEHVLQGLETFSVWVHPDKPDVVLAGTNDGVWISTDCGKTFDDADFDGGRRQVWCFMSDSRDNNRIYAGTSPIGILLSEDCGASWVELPDPGMPVHCNAAFDGRVMRMVQHPIRPDEIYAGLEINGAMRSDDGGQTWIDCSEHLIALSEQPHLKSKIAGDTFAEGMLDAHAITISPTNPDRVILAVRMGLFSSDDKGRTWQDMEVGRFSPTTYGRDVKTSPRDATTLYAALSVAAASEDGGIYRSQDAGKTWSRFDKIQVHGTIMSVALHPKDTNQVYVGARYNGEVFATIDGGATWSDICIPAEVKDIYCLSCG